MGQVFDVWLAPDGVRPLTELEIMRGLSGPDRAIGQDQFDVSRGAKEPPVVDQGRDAGRGDAVAAELPPRVLVAGMAAFVATRRPK